MSVIAKAQIVTDKKILKRGDNLHDLSTNEKRILINQGFAYSDEEFDSIIEDGLDVNESFILSEAELKKMKKKADIVEYAKNFGLELSEDLSKEELILAVLNFVEENAAE